MIRRLIKRIFGGDLGQAPTSSNATKTARREAPQRYTASELGVRNENTSPNAIRVCETLQKAGFQAYIVGGGVRDLLLGMKPKDFDVATNATPEQVKDNFRRAMIIGRRFRLVHVMFGREVIETSTFRALQVDAETDEHGRVLRDNVFGSQSDDAARRDFTVNALYYDPVGDVVLDYHDGVADLKAKRIRMIGDPATRYREDPVRMLRSVRFAAKLGFTIEQATRAPITELAPLINNVPSARLFDEMLKLLTSGNAMKCLRKLREEGLHHGLLPLLDVLLEQPDDERFIELALARTDERIHQDKSISPGFLFATLLWTLVNQRWQKNKARGDYPIPALQSAMDSVLDEQAEKLAIQRKTVVDMREIWGMQPRFERRAGHTAFRLLEHPRYRAAYDFLLLRRDAGEVDKEFGDWWQSFTDSDNRVREELVLNLKPATKSSSDPTKRRRRRRKPGADDADPSAAAPPNLGDS